MSGPGVSGQQVETAAADEFIIARATRQDPLCPRRFSSNACVGVFCAAGASFPGETSEKWNDVTSLTPCENKDRQTVCPGINEVRHTKIS